MVVPLNQLRSLGQSPLPMAPLLNHSYYRVSMADMHRDFDHDWRMAGEFDDIRQRLEVISEELADLAIVRLRESIDAGGAELPVDERRLTRARRAVDKAIGILSEADDVV